MRCFFVAIIIINIRLRWYVVYAAVVDEGVNSDDNDVAFVDINAEAVDNNVNYVVVVTAVAVHDDDADVRDYN